MREQKDLPPFWVRLLARFGCVATALVYALLGVVALLSLMRIRHGGADEASIAKLLEEVPGGKVVTGIILLGMLAFVVWRFYEAINDPYQYGRRWKGVFIRVVTACSAVSDALIGWPALASLLGTNTAAADGEPAAQRQSFAHLMEQGGAWAVCLVGLVTSVTAVVQFVYAFRRLYEERIEMDALRPARQTLVHVTAWVGQAARGIVLGIMGFFMLKAGLTQNAALIRNTDKAFDFLGDNLGRAVFAVVAVGTLFYAVFMTLLGYYYDFRKGR